MKGGLDKGMEHFGYHLPGSTSIEKLFRLIRVRFPLLQAMDLKRCHGLDDEACVMVATLFPKILHLNLGAPLGSERVTQRGIQSIANACTDLVSLNLTHCQGATDANIATIARNCKQLKKLILAGQRKTTTTNAAAVTVANDLPLLTHFEMKYLTITDTGLVAIAKRCSTLEYLDVRCEMAGEGLPDLACAQSLRTLKIAFKSIGTSANPFLQGVQPVVTTEANIVSFLQPCINMTDLDLTNCTQLTSVGVKEIVTCIGKRSVCYI